MLANFEAFGGRHDSFFGRSWFVWGWPGEAIQLAEAGLGLPERFVLPHFSLWLLREMVGLWGFLNLPFATPNDHLLQKGEYVVIFIRLRVARTGKEATEIKGLQVAKVKTQ